MIKTTDSLATGDKQQVELAHIFRLFGDDYQRSHIMSYEQHKAMRHIKICRTAELGGHVEQCDQCGFEKIAYNSCRDRHCPKCQTMTKEKWLNDRKAELLPCGYFHLVFTLPHDLNPIILSNRRLWIISISTASFQPAPFPSKRTNGYRLTSRTCLRSLLWPKRLENAISNCC